MNGIKVKTTGEGRTYLEEVATEMTLLFDITLGEAINRINKNFAGRDLLSDVAVSAVLLHEEQDVWAKHIMYGRDSFWWVNEDAAAPLPYEE